MSLWRCVSAIAGLIISAAAWSRGSECNLCTKEYTRCLADANGMTYAIQSCQAEEEQRQEVRLNAAYKRAQRRISSERGREMREVQRLWLRYREENARFRVGQGLSGDKIEASRFWLLETAMRVSELDRIQERGPRKFGQEDKW